VIDDRHLLFPERPAFRLQHCAQLVDALIERDPFLVLFGSEDLAVVLDAEFDACKAVSRAIAIAAVGVS
jgi:hypothetical protein